MEHRRRKRGGGIKIDVSSGVGGAGLFDVRVGALRTAAAQVHVEATDAHSAMGKAQGAANAAGGACGGPLLSAALARLAHGLDTDGGQLHQALTTAGTRLSSNADTYTSADQDASSGLASTFTALASWPTLGTSTR